MSIIKLTFKTVTEPDFGGFMFYVEQGRVFDKYDYAEAYGLNLSDLDEQNIQSVKNAAGRLKPGEWLWVEHNVVAEPMKTATWINRAGHPMAIAPSAEAACALWQADLQAALDAGNCTLDDFDGELPVYDVSNTNCVDHDVDGYANDLSAPDASAVVAAFERGELYRYC